MVNHLMASFALESNNGLDENLEDSHGLGYAWLKAATLYTLTLELAKWNSTEPTSMQTCIGLLCEANFLAYWMKRYITVVKSQTGLVIDSCDACCSFCGGSLLCLPQHSLLIQNVGYRMSSNLSGLTQPWKLFLYLYLSHYNTISETIVCWNGKQKKEVKHTIYIVKLSFEHWLYK